MMAWEGADPILIALLAAAVAWMYYRQSREPALAPATRARVGHEKERGPAGSSVGRYYARVARQAGFDPRSFLPTYWLVKAAFAIVPPLVVLDLAATVGWAPGLGWLAPIALLSFLLPDGWLLLARRARQRKITAALSHFLDMLVALLWSSVGLEEAFRRAARVGFPPNHPLAEEVELVSRELEAGQDSAVAFSNLAERTGVPGALAIASALRLGTRVGTSVQSTFEGQAELLWHAHVEEARGRIHKAALGATLGVMLCGFPIFAVFALFPVISELLETVRYLFEGLV